MANKYDSYGKMPRISKGFLFGGLVVAVIAYIVNYSSESLHALVPVRAPNKPYKTFEAFYPFYLSQHAEITNRRLHLTGTTLAIAIMIAQPAVIQSVIAAGSAGYIACALLAGVEHGFFEFAIVLGIFLAVSIAIGKWKTALAVPFIGYFFAWFGHFIFEKNRPATFIYPTFSLMGDFKMWFDAMTGRIEGVW